MAEAAQMLDCRRGDGEVAVFPRPGQAGPAARRPRARGARRPPPGEPPGRRRTSQRLVPARGPPRPHAPDPPVLFPYAEGGAPALSDSNLTPDQDDAVRALLAAARHTDPTPADVVARLDDALAALIADRRDAVRAERAGRDAGRRVVAVRRQVWLLAAAAVVVIGVGIGQILPSADSGDDSSAGSAADDLDARGRPDERRAAPGRRQRAASAEAGSAGGASSETTQRRREMRAQATAPTAIGGLSSNDRPQAPAAPAAPATTASDGLQLLGRSHLCAARRRSPAPRRSWRHLRRRPGALVFRAPVAGTQQVDVFELRRARRRTLPEPARTLRPAGRHAEHPRPTIGCTRRTQPSPITIRIPGALRPHV